MIFKVILHPLFLFFLGLSIGSFLNVVVERLPKGESVFGGRSHCDHCKKTLAWYDLVPVLSFVLLKRRCRYCHSPISWQYPLVELGTGMVFGLWGIREIGGIFGLLYYLFISSALIVIFASDWKYQIIPDQVILPAILATFIYLITYHVSRITYHFASGLSASAFFLFLHLITKRKGMGLGDVKLAFLMGLILGWPKILIALYFAFLTGALVGVILILTGKKGFGQQIPFGPFLVGGTFAAWFFGERILGYLGRLGYLGGI